MKRPIWLISILFLVTLIAPPAQANERSFLERARATEQALNDYFSNRSRQRAEHWHQQWAQRTPYPTPVPASERPRPWATAVAATATAWRTWSATMQAEAGDKIDRVQATLQAQHRATMTAQPTPTPKPTATPIPLYWDVTVLEVVEHYERLAAEAGYLAHYASGLIAGEQWIAVKLRVTSRGRSSHFAHLRSTAFIIGGTGRHSNHPPLSCPLSYHPLDAARLKAQLPGIEREFISARYPLLAPYHQFPSVEPVGPAVPTEGWYCFVIRDEDVPGARFAMHHPDGVNVTTWALIP